VGNLSLQNEEYMIVGLPKERVKNEQRVALVPDTVKKLVSSGFKVVIEKGAGENAFYPDSDYKSSGAAIVPDFQKLTSVSDIIVKVRPPEKFKGKSEASYLKPSSVIICLQEPLENSKNLLEYNKKKASSFALEFIPRSSLAQSMDVLSSMASLAGYKAVLMASGMISKIMPMMMTAAGTISAAKVLIIGAGVAGLQAIATAKRLGAVVEAFDTRPQVKEEVISLGGKFIDMELTADMQDAQGYAKLASPEFIKMEMELINKHLSKSDICITTAQVFGRKAPILIKDYMVKNMKPGSVIIDLAAETGGNCDLTKAGKTINVNGVKIVGVENITSELSFIASKLFSKNIENLLLYLVKDGKIHFENPDDEILKRTLLTHNGETVSELLKQFKPKGSR
jgi:NAD(P) transhydrogenase subunit alpha